LSLTASDLHEYLVGISVRQASNPVDYFRQRGNPFGLVGAQLTVDERVLPLVDLDPELHSLTGLGYSHRGMTTGASIVAVRESSPACLLAAVHKSLSNSKACWALAITCAIKHSDGPLERWDGETGMSLATSVEYVKHLPLLGYDIATIDRLSLLSNAGYTSDDINLAETCRWFRRLNEYGLLETIEDALECYRFQEERVPEHTGYIWAIRGIQLM